MKKHRFTKKPLAFAVALALAAVTATGPALAQLSDLLGKVNPTAAQISTQQVTQESLAAWQSCGGWQMIGFCLWVTYTIYGPVYQMEPKVQHFNPDVVISVFSMNGTNPWKEVQPYSKQALQDDYNFVRTDPGKGKPGNMIWKNVDAIGNPTDIGKVAGDSLLCESSTTGFVPYFLSSLDSIFWRTGITEVIYPQSSIPGLEDLGYGTPNDWGNVYPREAYIIGSDERKASPVIAYRAADIIYDQFAPHFYISARKPSRQGWWGPGSLMLTPLGFLTDSLNQRWQRLAPQPQTSCAVWPDETSVVASMSPATAATNDYRVLGPETENRGYVYNLWRPYACCQRGGSNLVTSTPTTFHMGI